MFLWKKKTKKNNDSEADRAIDGLNQRLFRGRLMTVARWDGVQNFAIEETQAEIENRDSAWADWLEDDEENDN